MRKQIGMMAIVVAAQGGLSKIKGQDGVVYLLPQGAERVGDQGVVERTEEGRVWFYRT